MTPTRLDPVELDVLWSAFGLGELPFPLERVAYGVTLTERDHLRAWARRRLAQRGLLPDGAGLARALGRPVSSVGVLAVAPGMAPIRAVAAEDGHDGVLATARPEGVTLEPIRPTALADTVAGLLPPVPAGPGRAVNLRVSDTRGPALRSVTPDPPVGGGQLRVVGPDRRVAIVSWFETRRGRYLAVHTGPGWLTVAPSDGAALRHRVGRLLDAA